MCTTSPPQSQVKITLERARPTHPLFENKNLILFPYMLYVLNIAYIRGVLIAFIGNIQVYLYNCGLIAECT